jgi:hypothetical protein
MEKHITLKEKILQPQDVEPLSKFAIVECKLNLLPSHLNGSYQSRYIVTHKFLQCRVIFMHSNARNKYELQNYNIGNPAAVRLKLGRPVSIRYIKGAFPSFVLWLSRIIFH